jgi:hypothetical protein
LGMGHGWGTHPTHTVVQASGAPFQDSESREWTVIVSSEPNH